MSSSPYRLVATHRPRCKSHSPQNSIGSDHDQLSASLTFSVSGADESCENSKKLRTGWVASTIGWRSVLCIFMTLLLVAYSLIQMGAQMLFNGSKGAAGRLRVDAQCPIRKWTYPNCKPFLISQNAPLPYLSSHEWHELRQKYQKVVGDKDSTLDPSWQRESSQRHGSSGFRVPVEVRSSPGKGRGVFTTAPVKKGQVLWDNRYTARFPDECSVRQFFDLIGEEQSCNAIMWAYVNNHFGLGPQFALDLDIAVYLNDAPEPEKVNMVNYIRPINDNPRYDAAQRLLHPDRYWQHRRTPGNLQMLASRDLEAGTELLMDYSQSHLYGQLFWFQKLCYRSRGFWGWLTML